MKQFGVDEKLSNLSALIPFMDSDDALVKARLKKLANKTTGATVAPTSLYAWYTMYDETLKDPGVTAAWINEQISETVNQLNVEEAVALSSSPASSGGYGGGGGGSEYMKPPVLETMWNTYRAETLTILRSYGIEDPDGFVSLDPTVSALLMKELNKRHIELTTPVGASGHGGGGGGEGFGRGGGGGSEYPPRAPIVSNLLASNLEFFTLFSPGNIELMQKYAEDSLDKALRDHMPIYEGEPKSFQDLLPVDWASAAVSTFSEGDGAEFIATMRSILDEASDAALKDLAKRGAMPEVNEITGLRRLKPVQNVTLLAAADALKTIPAGKDVHKANKEDLAHTPAIKAIMETIGLQDPEPGYLESIRKDARQTYAHNAQETLQRINSLLGDVLGGDSPILASIQKISKSKGADSAKLQAIASKLKKVKTKGMPAELKNIKALSEDYTKNVRTLGHINTVLNSVNRVKTSNELGDRSITAYDHLWRAYWLSQKCDMLRELDPFYEGPAVSVPFFLRTIAQNKEEKGGCIPGIMGRAFVVQIQCLRELYFAGVI